jgi:hypothetical protein
MIPTFRLHPETRAALREAVRVAFDRDPVGMSLRAGILAAALLVLAARALGA